MNKNSAHIYRYNRHEKCSMKRQIYIIMKCLKTVDSDVYIKL